MKFMNIKTGAILKPNSEMVIDQMKRSDLYKEVKEGKETKAKEVKEGKEGKEE